MSDFISAIKRIIEDWVEGKPRLVHYESRQPLESSEPAATEDAVEADVRTQLRNYLGVQLSNATLLFAVLNGIQRARRSQLKARSAFSSGQAATCPGKT